MIQMQRYVNTFDKIRNHLSAIISNYFPAFETINFPITVTGWPNFAASLWTLCQSDLSFSTYEPSHKIPDQTHKLPSIQ